MHQSETKIQIWIIDLVLRVTAKTRWPKRELNMADIFIFSTRKQQEQHLRYRGSNA